MPSSPAFRRRSGTSNLPDLPIDALLPAILRTLREHANLVLEAAPGAGKTTRVPPALLGMVPGEVLVLEPRRLAARMAARRVAHELGEPVGETVGYQVRFEEVAGPRTRLRFVTEGILTRRLLSDPALRGVDLVVLDEFHERHLDTDLALALLRRLQATTRPELKLLVMSATLDTAPVARFLAPAQGTPAPVLRSEGRVFPLTVEHLPYSPAALERQVRAAVEQLLREGQTRAQPGHILVLLPGLAEIRRAERECAGPARAAGMLVLPLHGDLTPEEQDRAVSPSPQTKLILATNVAESSVTIEGVTAVIDSGLARSASTSPWTGLPTLTVGRISRASARQRAGRAGRTAPGRVLRLYPEADFLQRPEHDPPEIARADLAQLSLHLRAMGIEHATEIGWLDTPPAPAVHAAEALLDRLGATTVATAKALARYPLPPRLARVLQEAIARGVPEQGMRAAALLGSGARPARIDILAALDEPLEPRAEQQLAQLRRVIRQKSACSSAERPHTSSSRPERPHSPSSPPERPHPTSPRPEQPYPPSPRPEQPHPTSPRTEQPYPPSSRPEQPYPPSSRPERSGAERSPHSPPPIPPPNPDDALLLALLTGFPDRVAGRRKDNTLQLASGLTADLQGEPPPDDLLLVLDAEDRPEKGLPLARLTARCEPEWLLDLFPERLHDDTALEWNRAGERVEAVSTLRYDELVIEQSHNTRPDPEAAAAFLAARALEQGTERFLERFLDLKDRESLASLLARLRFAGLPEPSLEDTLRSLCTGLYSFADLRAASPNFLPLLEQSIDTARLRTLAPATLRLPGGREVRVQYAEGKPPAVASRLQDFFGLHETPRIGPGRTPVVAQLLAPNHRPVQTTDDLAGFWTRLYPQVRRELSRRYPRHPWPEKP